jgi:hypothetical protein
VAQRGLDLGLGDAEALAGALMSVLLSSGRCGAPSLVGDSVGRLACRTLVPSD